MDPGEVFFLLGFLVVLPLTVLRMTFRYKERKMKLSKGVSGEANSMTMTELEVLVEDAVKRGVEPLDYRMSGLEQRLDQLLPPASTKLGRALLDDSDLSEMESPAKTVGKIQRLS
jgi:hypothetical protein